LNALDPTIKESATIDKFKRNLKTALLRAGLLLNNSIRFSYIVTIFLLQAYLCELYFGHVNKSLVNKLKDFFRDLI